MARAYTLPERRLVSDNYDGHLEATFADRTWTPQRDDGSYMLIVSGYGRAFRA